jgi:hypothetical protein
MLSTAGNDVAILCRQNAREERVRKNQSFFGKGMASEDSCPTDKIQLAQTWILLRARLQPA